MPEGDSIFRTARTLHRALAGHMVTRFESVFPQLTRVHDDEPITGRVVERVESRGKHVLIYFAGDLILRTHMRMSGSWHIYRPGEAWQRPMRDMRIVVGTAAFVAIAFTVHVAEFETSRTIERNESLGSLGPDLLSDAFDRDEALARLRAQGTQPIGEVLLNQRVMAGIGNIFKSETLFLTGVNPFAPVASLSDDRLRALVDTARTLLHANVTPSSGHGIVTYTGLRPHAPRVRMVEAGLRQSSARRTSPEDRVWVYGRGGEPCRKCGTPIERRKVGLDARSTYWCPRCQPAAEAAPSTD